VARRGVSCRLGVLPRRMREVPHEALRAFEGECRPEENLYAAEIEAEPSPETVRLRDFRSARGDLDGLAEGTQT